MAAEKFRVGDQVRIVNNTCDHRFARGEVVEISNIYTDVAVPHYEAKSATETWYMDDDDLEAYEA